MANNSNASGVLIVLASIVTNVVFVVLKILGVIAWSWVFVFSPLILLGLLGMLVVIAIPILGSLAKMK